MAAPCYKFPKLIVMHKLKQMIEDPKSAPEHVLEATTLLMKITKVQPPKGASKKAKPRSAGLIPKEHSLSALVSEMEPIHGQEQ